MDIIKSLRRTSVSEQHGTNTELTRNDAETGVEINEAGDFGDERPTPMLDRAINFITYFLIFSLPLFFLPYTFEFYNFNKLFLLFYGVSAIFLLTFWRFLRRGQIRIVRTPLDLPILAFLFFAFLSTVFSSAKTSAFMGFYGKFSGSFMEILLLVLFFWLVVQNYAEQTRNNAEQTRLPAGRQGTNAEMTRNRADNISRMISLILFSSFFVVLYGLVALFDLWRFFPESGFLKFLSESVVSPTGLTFQGLAMYLSGVLIFLVGLMMARQAGMDRLLGPIGPIGRIGPIRQLKDGFITRILYWFLLLASFLIVALVDFWASWVALAIGMAVLLGFLFSRRLLRERGNWLVIPIFLFLFSLILLGLSAEKILGVGVSKEVLLPYSTSLKVAGSSFLDHPALGSGPGNFWYDFNLNKGDDFMSSAFWQLRFSRSHSAFLENLSGQGTLGFLAWFSVIAMFFLISYHLLKKLSRESKTEEILFLPLFMGLAGWFLASVLYPQNILLNFYFWLFLALGVLGWGEIQSGVLRTRTINLKKFQELGVVFLSVFIILTLTVFVFWWQGARVWAGDAAYRKALAADATLEQKIEHLTEAVKLAGHREVYFTNLSRLYLAQANTEAGKAQNDRDQQKLANSVSSAIQTAKRATEINPRSVSAWENMGGVYRDLSGVAENAGVWAEDSFKNAVALEPANPFLYVSLGRTQMTLAISVDDKGGTKINEEKMAEALANIKKAKDLKPEYLGSYLNEALALESKGSIDEAVKSLDDYFNDFIALGRGFWQDQSEIANYFFQRGRFYYNQEELDKAATNFIQAINLVPLHSNARYSLALTFEKQGKIEEALRQLEIVSQLNPGNQALEDKIGELKGE